jgi:nicotinamidase-related amidase
MGAVSRILEFKPRWETPTLVLVDLHAGPPASASSHDQDGFRDALEKCRAALSFARQRDLPVAFVRHMSPSPSFLAMHTCPSWIQDIRPARSDMIFERSLPSCFASSEFAQMARCSGGLVLAGIFGETSCLATLMDGYNRSHLFTYLTDASVSRGHNGIPADEIHRSVVGIASIYSEISSTDAWIDKMSSKMSAIL